MHILDCYLGPVGDGDACPAAVDRLVAVDDELLGEADRHVAGEHDPERLRPDDGIAEGAGAGVYELIVGGVRNDVETVEYKILKTISLFHMTEEH